jgi:hypothetical protein
MKGDDEIEEYSALNARRRIVIGLIAISTAVGVVLMLFYPPGGVKRTRAAVPECSASQPRDCVGGKAEVIYVAPAAASAASR